MEFIYEDYVKSTRDEEETGRIISDAIHDVGEQSSCASVLDQFRKEQGSLYTDKLKSLCENPDKTECGNFKYNSFPFGISTNEVLPEFVGVYFNKNKYKKSLRDVLNEAKTQCVRMGKKYPFESRKRVLILTDTWNSYTFRRYYALPFINYAHQYNITIVCLLVTDFGVTRIPFINQRYGKHVGNSDVHVYDTNSAKAKNILSKFIDFPHFEYESQGSTLNRFDGACRLSFDYIENEYCYEYTKNYEGKVKKGMVSDIPDEVLEKFALNVIGLANIRESCIKEDRYVLDASEKTAVIFNRKFIWQLGDEEPFKTLQKAFSYLINEIDTAI